MSIRIVIIALLCVFFCIYAWRNCFVSVCASVVLMAIMQHPDVIADLKSIGGIQGLNIWNILIANVFLAWRWQRRISGFAWDLPTGLQLMFFLYAAAMVVSVGRLLVDPTGAPETQFLSNFSEYVINCFKWFIPGIILYDLCRTRRRVEIALVCIVALYFLLAVQVIKHVPLQYAISDSFNTKAYKLVQNSVGYNRVTLSMMLGGASWAALGLLALARTKKQRWIICGVALAIAAGQSLTGGRSGYFSWAVVGTILCIARWRKFLPLIPLAVIAIFTFLPGVRDRLLMGIGIGSKETDAYEATSGRNIAWPYVIEQIGKSPVFGHGREGMSTSGVFHKILFETEDAESFPHPHNAYLEVLLDMGWVGFFCVIPFFLLILWRCFSVFLDRSDLLFAAAGGIACSLVVALLVASMGGQTFYPREGSVGMWAAIGIALRVYVERMRAAYYGEPLFGENEAAGDDTIVIEESDGFAVPR